MAIDERALKGEISHLEFMPAAQISGITIRFMEGFMRAYGFDPDPLYNRGRQDFVSPNPDMRASAAAAWYERITILEGVASAVIVYDPDAYEAKKTA